MRPHLAACCTLAALAVVIAATSAARAASAVDGPGLYTAGQRLPQVDGDIRIEVRGPFADVVVTQTFRNDLDRGIEAVYVFPLPADAAVRSMRIVSGDRTITAEVARRADARAAYEQAVAAGTEAALTEQERANVLTQQVTGIEPGAEVAVELRFDLALGRWRSGWELALPLVVGPRDVAGVATGAPSTGTGSAPDTDRAPDASRVTPPVRGDRGGNPVTIVAELGDVPRDAVEIPTHDGDVTRARGRTRVTVQDARSDRDLVIRWASSDARGAHAVAGRTDDGGVVAIVVEAPAAPPDARAARRWLLAVDASGSMDGDAIVLARRAARALIDRVGDDLVAVLGPDGGAPAWRRGERGRALAREAVDAIEPSGGSDLAALVDAAVAAADAAGTGPEVAIVVVTDGLVADDAAVAARVAGAAARVHAIGVGAAPNRWLLGELARRGRGVAEVLTPGDDVDAVVGALVASAGAPPVTPTIDWGGLDVRDVAPATLPALAAGGAIVVAGRVDRLADATVTVRAGDRRLVAKLRADAAGRDGLVARRWAWARIDELVASGGDVADEVTRLGLAHGLVTPYTALVARGERVSVEGGVRTTVAVPVAMPAGMRWQAVFGPGGDAGAGVVVPDADVVVADGEDDREAPTAPEEAGAAAPPYRTTVPASGDVMTESILVHGRVILTRTWSGSLQLTGGVVARDDEAAGQVTAHAGVYRSLTARWKVGAAARLSLAPALDGGVDAAAYVAARGYLPLGPAPLVALDLGAGPSLDVPGVAWRLGLRLGPWRFAPVLAVDQTLVRDDGAWTRRTSVGLGLELSF